MPDTSSAAEKGTIAVWADGFANLEAHIAAYRRLVRDIIDGAPVTNIFYIGNFFGPGANPIETIEFLQRPASFAKLAADVRGDMHELTERSESSDGDYITARNPGGKCPTIDVLVAAKYERGFCAAIESMADDTLVPKFDNKKFVFTREQEEFEEEVKPALEAHVKAFFGGYRPKAFSDVVHRIINAMGTRDADLAHIQGGKDLIARAIRDEELKDPALRRELTEITREAKAYGAIDPHFGVFDIRPGIPTELTVFGSFLKLTDRGKNKLLYSPEAEDFFLTAYSTRPNTLRVINNYNSLKRSLYAYAFLLFKSGMLPGEGGKPADNRTYDNTTLDGVFMCNDSPRRPGSGKSLEPESTEFKRDYTFFPGKERIIVYANTGRFGAVHDSFEKYGAQGRLWVNVPSISNYVGEDPSKNLHGKGAFIVFNLEGDPRDAHSVARPVRFKYDFETAEGKRREMVREARG